MGGDLHELLRREPGLSGVISATRGNHGQSIALAAASHGVAATIVEPHGNSVEKNAAMRAFGAELIEFGLDGAAFRRIPNGVDAALFFPAPAAEQAALRAASGLPTDKILFAFVGRLTQQKRPDILLEAWSRCATSRRPRSERRRRCSRPCSARTIA